MIRSARRPYRCCALLGLLALLPALALAQGTPTAPMAAGSGSPTKIGYIDMKRVLDNAPQQADSRSKLEHEFAARDAALKSDETRLATLRQRPMPSGASEAEALKREIDALERGIKRTREDLRSELASRAHSESDRVWQKINNSVIEYAREQGYDLILLSPVIYASARIDITEQVLDRLKREAQADAGAARSNSP